MRANVHLATTDALRDELARRSGPVTPRDYIKLPAPTLRRLLRLARATAENLEADKHRMRGERELVEVQLLTCVDGIEKRHLTALERPEAHPTGWRGR